MKEQSELLTSKSIPAIHVTSGDDESTLEASFEGCFHIIFISPEHLLGKRRYAEE